MSNAKFAAAKELIDEQQYAAARALLKTMPKDERAREWLRKLPKPKRRIPWRLLSYLFVLFLGVGIGSSGSGRSTTTRPTPTAQVAASAPTAAPTTNTTPTKRNEETRSAPTATFTITPSLTITPTPTPNLAGTEGAISGEQTRQALNAVAQATNLALSQVPPTSAAPAAFDEAEYVRLLSDGLFILAGGRNVDYIRVPDGRANGGERNILIGYLTTESTEVGFADEWIDLFSATAATIRANDLDVDSITLLAGNASGAAVGTLTASVGDLLAFHEGRISRAEFLNRLEVVML